MTSSPGLALPASARGYLEPGSNPSVLPGPVLIADRANNRLVIVDPRGRILWEFPRRSDLGAGQTFLAADDAFLEFDIDCGSARAYFQDLQSFADDLGTDAVTFQN